MLQSPRLPIHPKQPKTLNEVAPFAETLDAHPRQRDCETVLRFGFFPRREMGAEPAPKETKLFDSSRFTVSRIDLAAEVDRGAVSHLFLALSTNTAQVVGSSCRETIQAGRPDSFRI